MTRQTFAFLLGLSIFCTWLNALKPAVIDDPIYLAFGRQIASNPLDPYGFQFGSVPANHVLSPPVALHWLGAGMRIVGEDVALLKWWFLPFHLLFVFSLFFLFRRFSGGCERWLVSMTALSPVFLPAMNLMVDVPALALALTALVIFVRAVDRDSIGTALLAGLVAGLALQTKYATFVMPLVMLIYAAIQRQWRLGLIAFTVAWALFALWEVRMAQGYGQSHFLRALHDRRGPISGKLLLILPTIGILGGVAPAVALLGEAGLRRNRGLFLTLAAMVVLGFVLLAVVPDRFAHYFVNPESGRAKLTLNNLVVGILGLWVMGSVTMVCHRLWRGSGEKRLDAFLILWLLIELGGCLALTPFPAARRVMGVVVVMTLLAGRLVVRGGSLSIPHRRVRLACGLSTLLGGVFWVSDWHAAREEQRLAQDVAHWIQQEDAHARSWCLAPWGMEHYCQQVDVTPALGKQFQPRPGDFLIMDSRREEAHREVLAQGFVHVGTWTPEEIMPLQTQACYYAAATPIRHRSGPRFRLQVYRLSPAQATTGRYRTLAR